ncbi:hypothetical protein OIU85_000237 [Salix viminalis]|uniref:Uncharacterized protein n=1 Tax=Salix viminalis TaxID=40686 RepID=A0A9Q0ZWT5_SALVM|nr:hypothetical protein OIU85_000237 [Salix viminalis]
MMYFGCHVGLPFDDEKQSSPSNHRGSIIRTSSQEKVNNIFQPLDSPGMMINRRATSQEDADEDTWLFIYTTRQGKSKGLRCGGEEEAGHSRSK